MENQSNEPEQVQLYISEAEFNAFLETLAQLVESKVKTPEEAAALIRQATAQ
ncbi:MAG: putative porin [Agathobaculum sp.]|uniref:hypothetical protein n=1 Tax=Agathobaculum sp. TaxID=2048138 RepID=UPI0025C08AFD|nr:hypothetical protein [Agathobaculum sp.]MCI7124582.1 putative porin [Agathobaculum sp.]MDY3711859.1 hypothetical protein [Agathobaculum sp.]